VHQWVVGMSSCIGCCNVECHHAILMVMVCYHPMLLANLDIAAIDSDRPNSSNYKTVTPKVAMEHAVSKHHDPATSLWHHSDIMVTS